MTITLYGFIRFLHVFCAIAAMGPHFVTVFLLRHMSKNPESVPVLAPLTTRIAMFPKHGAILMLLTGVLIVALNPAGWVMFEELWLAGSMVLFLFNVIYGRVKVDPAGKALAATLAKGPVKAGEVGALTARLESAFHPMTISLVLIIILMIFRPAL